VTHYNDLGDIQLGHAEFQRSRDTMASAAGFEWRNQVSDVADHEYLARVGVEDGRRIRAAVTAGDHNRSRGLALGELLPSLPRRFETIGAKPSIALKQVSEPLHQRTP
jgi:hypothetical protein